MRCQFRPTDAEILAVWKMKEFRSHKKMGEAIGVKPERILAIIKP